MRLGDVPCPSKRESASIGRDEPASQVDDRLEDLLDVRLRVAEDLLDLSPLALGACEPCGALGFFVDGGGRLEAFGKLCRDDGIEGLGACLASALCRVHGEIGTAQELVDGHGPGGGSQRSRC